MADIKPLILNSGKEKQLASTDTIATSNLGTGTANSSSYLRGDQTWATVTATPPDIATSLLAPSTDETIAANSGAVVPRRYTIASGKKLTLGLGSIFRIL